MHEIKKFKYNRNVFDKIRNYRYGENWPIVYILEDGKEAYIGETVAAYKRAAQHYEIPERAKLNKMYIIADDEYNKSATQDIESNLIRYMSGDGKYLLQNANLGLRELNYYDRERYQSKFEIIWKELQELNVVYKNLIEIENSDLFKYSPYKALSQDQLDVVTNITNEMQVAENGSFLVSGEPGTGKTIVATYLLKALTSFDWSKGMKVGLVIPMTSLRATLKRVSKTVKGLGPSMVLGPNDVVKQKYDILIVDEAHRLQRRKNITNYRDFDRINSQLGLDKDNGTQLDWILNSSKFQVLFYDKNQSIKPADIRSSTLNNSNFVKYSLTSQMRVKGGKGYINYIREILEGRCNQKEPFSNYDLILFTRIKDLVEAIKEKDSEYGLSRILAGYAWEWRTKGSNAIDYDIEIEGQKLKWNSVTKDWVNSFNAINEVGCIHTIQGYDLNYAGVIIGPEVNYDKKTGKIVVDKNKYLDFNGKRAISDPEELEIYVKNIYKTLLTRGIKGTYVYAVNEELRNYLKEFLNF